MSAFLDSSYRVCNLEKAVKTNDLRLLRRLAAHSKLPLLSTRRYPLFLRFHVCNTAVLAAEGGHYEALKLLHAIRSDAFSDDAIVNVLSG